MCCFAGPVKSVTNTNLFARMSGSGTQMLAYQMDFETEKENAMILPIPVAKPSKEDSLRFISLKKYDNLFDDMDDAFPVIRPPSRFRIDSRAPTSSPPMAANLAVHEVGDFVASFVPTMDDFARLDQRFVIPRSSWEKIPQYNDYGFAVFQLKNLRGKPHPMAFEFQTRLKDELFFPTVHIHDGEVHERERFDHHLYLQNPAYDEVVGSYLNYNVADRQTGYVRSKENAGKSCRIDDTAGLVQADQLLHRIRLRGILDNKDVIAPMASRQGNASPYRLGTLAPFAPALVGIAGLGWIVHRRNQIRAIHSDS